VLRPGLDGRPERGRAAGRDRPLARWFVDKGKTGDNLKRPAFEKLQAAIFCGEVATVVVYKLDRLSRKLREGLDVLCDWCDKGLRVVSVTQQIDFNGTVGKMLAAVLLGIAEMEQENRKERQKDGIAEAKKAGKYQGRRRGTTKAKDGPAEAIKLRDKGNSVEQIAKSLGVSRNTVFVYLRTAANPPEASSPPGNNGKQGPAG